MVRSAVAAFRHAYGPQAQQQQAVAQPSKLGTAVCCVMSGVLASFSKQELDAGQQVGHCLWSAGRDGTSYKQRLMGRTRQVWLLICFKSVQSGPSPHRHYVRNRGRQER